MGSKTCQRTGLQSQKAQGVLLALFEGPLQKDPTELQPWANHAPCAAG